MNCNKHLHWVIYILFLSSCAKQSSPTGGPKDTIPPVLVKAIPSDEAINFKGKDLELLFSEQVILNSPKDQLIVTPTIGKDYEIAVRKNSVIISFEDDLKDSTTYTFNFRESVQDITEKNPVRNLQVAFSTGNYIDSLSVEGTIYDLIRGKEVAEATVALHVENDTFSILEDPAIYFTKTDKQGKFKISHLKADNYFIYAFDDKNRNLIVDSRTESYGFISEYLYLIESVKDVSLGLIRLDARPLKLTSARPYNTYFNIRTAKNLRTYELTQPDSIDLVNTFGEDNANIRVYKTTDQDSLKIHLSAYDSINNKIDTTLYAKYLTREVTKEKFGTDIQSTSIIAEKGLMDATLVFTKPVRTVNFDSIYFEIDSLRKITFLAKDLTYEPLTRRLTISKKVDKSLFITDEVPSGTASRRAGPQQAIKQPASGSSNEQKKPIPLINELYLGTGAFISIENDSSVKVTEDMKPLREADLSIINIEIRTQEKFYIVELVDSKFDVIRRFKNIPRLRFTDLKPGDYQVRLIIDKNQNGRWDPGNYQTKTEAEKIIYYRAADKTTVIKGVKANWEIGTGGEMFITY